MDFQDMDEIETPAQVQDIALQNMEVDLNESQAMPDIELLEYDLETKMGYPLRVYMPTTCAKGKFGIITFHDIGTNYKSMLSFFDHPEMRVILQRFTVYHICAPGHQYTCEGLPPNSSSTPQTGNIFTISDPETGISTPSYPNKQSSDVPNSWPSEKPYPTMDQLSELVDLVVKHFSIKYFVGFGVGAGSNVLARYALKYPKGPVLGLFLLNPNDSTHGSLRWFRMKWFDLPKLIQRKFYTDHLLDRLSDQWFGYNQCDNLTLAEKYETQLRSMCPISVAGYIQAYIDRTNLGLVRDVQPAGNTSNNNQTSNFQVDCCLVTGNKAEDLVNNLYEMNSRINPDKVYTIVIADSNGMVMEEKPEALVVNFLHFLRQIGLAAQLSPEKLKRQSSDQRLHLTGHSASTPIESVSTPSPPTLVHFNSEFVL